MTVLEQYQQKGFEKGLYKGKLEGKLEEKLDVAKNMLELGFSIENIAQATHLSESKIEEIKARIDLHVPA